VDLTNTAEVKNIMEATPLGNKKVVFKLDSTKIVDLLEDYKPSVKRELRQLRAMGLIKYKPIADRSPVWIFSVPKKKNCTYKLLYDSFLSGVDIVRNPENTTSASYKIRQLIANAKSTN